MHVGMWGLAVIVIVVVSWLLYRYLAPDNWKEWTRAGVLQAFIIAFYAEMYAYRRKWATERKHLPDSDVAAAGGWTNPNTLRLVYQQADQETMLRVVLERGELREAK